MVLDKDWTLADNFSSINQSNFYSANISGKAWLSGVTAELAERTGSGRLFQRDGAQEWKALAPVLVLTVGTDKLLSMFDISEREGSDAASMEWS